jgi:2-oxoglutarate ferredoxin oxidoreductase subunit beta
MFDQNRNTWCPGCTNNIILSCLEEALGDLVRGGAAKKNKIVLVTDIGCNGKIYDLWTGHSFYSLHGRVIPTCIGIKSAKPELTVIGLAGDGGTYSEGLSHLISASRYNPDMVMLVVNNGVFALTKGQPTATGEALVGPALNPLALALVSGASFVARASTSEPNQLSSLIKKAILHRGFSFLDVLQPCLTFNDTRFALEKNSYKFSSSAGDRTSLRVALKKALEWDYSFSSRRKIGLGIFYQKERKTWEEKLMHAK